jgi:hypothetical protein
MDEGRDDPTLTIMEIQKLLETLGPRLRVLEECHQPPTRLSIMQKTWSLTSVASST